MKPRSKPFFSFHRVQALVSVPFFLAFFFFFALFAVEFAVNSSVLQQRINSALQKELGVPLSVNGKIQIGCFPTLQLVFTDISLAAPLGAGQSAPLLTVPKLAVDIAVEKLVHGVVELGNITVSDAQIVLAQRENGAQIVPLLQQYFAPLRAKMDSLGNSKSARTAHAATSGTLAEKVTSAPFFSTEVETKYVRLRIEGRELDAVHIDNASFVYRVVSATSAIQEEHSISALHGSINPAADKGVSLQFVLKSSYGVEQNVSVIASLPVFLRSLTAGENSAQVTGRFVDSDSAAHQEEMSARVESTGSVTLADREIQSFSSCRVRYDRTHDALRFDALQLGLDRGRVQGTLEMPAFSTLFASAPNKAEDHAAQKLPQSSATKSHPNYPERLRGTLAVEHLSLPFWFGFAAYLPTSLQHALDDISGTLDFSMTANSVFASRIDAQTLGLPLSGYGGVADFSHPVIDLELTGDYVDVNRVFPEMAVTPPKVLPRPVNDAQPVFVITQEEMDAPRTPDDVGFDIRIAAKKADAWAFSVNDLTFRCYPSPTGTYTSYRIGSVYGGSADALLDIRKDFFLKLNLKDIDTATPAKLISGEDVLSGKLFGSAELSANAHSVMGLLAALTGTVDARIEHGHVAFRSARDAAGNFSLRKTPFDRIRLKGTVTGKSGNPETAFDAPLVPYLWQGTGEFLAGARHVLLTQDGVIDMDKNGLPARFHNVQSVVDLTERVSEQRKKVRYVADSATSVRKERAVQNVKFHAQARVNADMHAGNVQLTQAHARFLTAELAGELSCHDIYDAQSPWHGDVSLASAHIRPVLEHFTEESFPQIPDKMLRSFNASAQMTWQNKFLALRNFVGTLDASAFRGEIVHTAKGAVALARPNNVPAPSGKPLYEGTEFVLHVENLDADAYFYKKVPFAKPDERLWNIEPLRTLRAKGALSVASLRYSGLTYNDLTAYFRASNGSLVLSPIQAKFYGGTLDSTCAVRLVDAAPQDAVARAQGYATGDGVYKPVAKELDASFDIDIKNMNFAEVSQAVTGKDYLGGIGALKMSVRGPLRSSADIPRALNGDWSIALQKSYYKTSTPQGKKRLGTSAEKSSTVPINYATASGILRRGVLYNSNLNVNQVLFSITGSGQADLVNKQINYTAVLAIAKLPAIPIRITGSLYKPKMDTNALEILPRTLENLGVNVFDLLKGVITLPIEAGQRILGQ